MIDIWDDSEWARILAFQVLKPTHDARAEDLKAAYSHRLSSEYGAFLQAQRKIEKGEIDDDDRQ